jgi:hypothetical protein
MERQLLSNSPFTLFNKSLDVNCSIRKKVKHIPAVEDQEDKVAIYNEQIKLFVDAKKYNWHNIKHRDRHELLKLYLEKIDKDEVKQIFFSPTTGDLLLLDIAIKSMNERLHPAKVGNWVYNKLFDPEIIKQINKDLSNELGSRSEYGQSDEDQLRIDDNKDRLNSIKNWG